MAILDLFSEREKRRRGEVADVYQYDDLPRPFRVQVIHIWAEAIGHWHDARLTFVPTPLPLPNRWWGEIFRMFTREKGAFQLSEGGSDPFEQCERYLQTAATDDALDLIEVTFCFIDGVVRATNEYERRSYNLVGPDSAIEELNGRFREHAIGYEFAGGRIVRVDSTYVHAEAVRPALQLMHDAGPKFAGPLQEFLDAHERYRKGNCEDALVWACKAFESTMKVICAERGWPFEQHKDTASKLLQIVFANGLVPDYLQTQFTALKSVMESGVPTVRNKEGGHGRGTVTADVPPHLVRYALHLTASNIVLLIECHKGMR